VKTCGYKVVNKENTLGWNNEMPEGTQWGK